MNAVLAHDDLLYGYTAYTSAAELDVMDGGDQAAAFSPTAATLVPILVRAGLIAARSSQNCAIAIARTTGGIANTIAIVC